METAKQTAQAALDALGLTVESVFVPWSRSRNKGEKSPSLNWIVTVKRNGKDVLTKGETIYRACLEIALKLRAAIGEAGLAALQNAFQDY